MKSTTKATILIGLTLLSSPQIIPQFKQQQKPLPTPPLLFQNQPPKLHSKVVGVSSPLLAVAK